MKRWIKRILLGLGVVLLLTVVAVTVFAWSQTSAFDASVEKVYDVPIPQITRSTDPAVIARGKHLAESMSACAARQARK